MQTARNRRIQVEEDDGGSRIRPFLYILFLLALVGVTIFGVYVVLHMDKFFPKEEEEVEVYKPPVKKPASKPPEPPPKPPEEKPAEPPPPPKKTLDEMRAELAAAQKVLDAAIAKARTETKPIPGLKGVRFGDIVKGEPVQRKALPFVGTNADEVASFVCAVYGEPLKKPLRGFPSRPLLWVTPKTHRVFGIAFERDVTAPGDGIPAPETTNVVAALSKMVHRDPLTLDFDKLPLAEREYFYPLGDTTIRVGEYGGKRLKVVAEHGGILAEARGESEAVHKREMSTTGEGKALGSKRYPNGGMVKTGFLRTKKVTPPSFCGIVFGSAEPHDARRAKSNCKWHGFYIDYRQTGCNPFMGFDHGHAETGLKSGGVYAVELVSAGPDNGLFDAEYFGKVRKAIERHYKIEPKSVAGDSACPELHYTIGDVEITLGPDSQGGYRLRAVHTLYEALWKVP